MNNTTVKKERHRELGIDLVKVLACLGVVALHTVNAGKGVINQCIALLATTCIPLFFMVSGYLMFRRPALDYKYALKKIGRILAVCFAWEFLHAAAYFLYYREFRNFLESFLLDFFQEGLFYHFWYMGALIIVYLIMPLMHKLMKKSPKGYTIVLAGLCIVNVVIDLLAIILRRQFVLEVPQNLRCWFWLLYAMIGGYIASNNQLVQKVSSGLRGWAVIAALALMVVWQHWIGNGVFGHTVIEAFYGSFPVQLAVAALFLYVRKLNIPGRAGKWSVFLASLTMGIYIMHPFVLAVFNKFVPAFTQSGSMMNLLFWLVTTVACGIATAVVQKIPLAKQLLRL